MQGAGNGEYRKGLWTVEEDKILMDHVKLHGEGKWNHAAKVTGLKRCGKSCRLRWMNYLSPSVKRGEFSEEEDDLIIRLHKLLGNRWSLIAGRVPGRTDNQVKNHWNTHLSKKLGIKKKDCKISGSSSKFFKRPGANFKSKLNSNDEPIICCNGEAEIQNIIQDNSQKVKDSSEKVKEITGLEDPILMSDCYDNFWLPSDDPCPWTSNLMELLNQSLDFF